MANENSHPHILPFSSERKEQWLLSGRICSNSLLIEKILLAPQLNTMTQCIFFLANFHEGLQFLPLADYVI